MHALMRELVRDVHVALYTTLGTAMGVKSTRLSGEPQGGASTMIVRCGSISRIARAVRSARSCQSSQPSSTNSSTGSLARSKPQIGRASLYLPGNSAPDVDELVLDGAVGEQAVVRAHVAADRGFAAGRRVQVHGHVDAVPLAQRQRGVQSLQLSLQPGVVIRQRTGLPGAAMADQLPPNQVRVPLAAQRSQAVLVDVGTDHRAAQSRQLTACEGDTRGRGRLAVTGALATAILTSSNHTLPVTCSSPSISVTAVASVGIRREYGSFPVEGSRIQWRLRPQFAVRRLDGQHELDAVPGIGFGADAIRLDHRRAA